MQLQLKLVCEEVEVVELVQLQFALEALEEQVGCSYVFWTSDDTQQEQVLFVELDEAQLH